MRQIERALKHQANYALMPAWRAQELRRERAAAKRQKVLDVQEKHPLDWPQCYPFW